MASAALTHSFLFSTLSPRKTHPLRKADFNITKHAGQPLLKDRVKLMANALVVRRKAVGGDAAQQSVAEIFEVRTRPPYDLCRFALHPFYEVQQHRRCLLHRFLVERIGGLRRTYDYSVASKCARHCRVRFNVVSLVQQLVAAFVH
jgi:hypothetical protein